MKEQPIFPACPDDLGELSPVDSDLQCGLCGRRFSSVDGIVELLPIEAFQESSEENIQLNAYRASFSNRLDRSWDLPLRAFVNKLGNGYLHSWVARSLEELGNGHPFFLLDAACGEGISRRYISSRHCYIGIDFSKRPLVRAQRYYPATYYRADLNHLPFRNATFDVVFSCQSLQYLKRPEIALAQMSRVLKPSGKLLLTVPNNESFKYWFQGIPQLQLQQFDRRSLPALLALNFEVLDIKTRGFWVPLPLVSIHAPGVYPARWGLSWTVLARPKK